MKLGQDKTIKRIIMESKELKINVENVLSEYTNADENGKKLLENLFGKDVFVPKNVMDRVKTFEDACRELGENHPLVKSYETLCSVDTDSNLETYAKLRIIVAALNEGWEPMFTTEEWRYYPWFYIYTQEEIEKMDEDEKKELCLWGGNAYNGPQCGLGCSFSNNAFSDSDTNCGARLALKSSELAKYCGKQFIEIWSDYLFK